MDRRNTYPVIDVDISSASHPFWTGRQRLLDTAGRVEKFRAKYARKDAGGWLGDDCRHLVDIDLSNS